MKIVRVDSNVDDITYGAVEPEGIRLHLGSPFVAWEPTETVVGWDQARLLAPVIPTKIIAVGRNYVDHANDMDNPIPEEPPIFLKPPTSVIGPLQAIRYPAESSNVHHEAELAIVVGKVARDVRIEDAGSYIMGYTAANDVTVGAVYGDTTSGYTSFGSPFSYNLAFVGSVYNYGSGVSATATGYDADVAQTTYAYGGGLDQGKAPAATSLSIS